MTDGEIIQLWTGEGLLWKNLHIHRHGVNLIGTLSDSKSFMTDRSITFKEGTVLSDAIAFIVNEDADFFFELTLYGEEGG